VEHQLHLKLIIPDLEHLPLFSADIEEQICNVLNMQFYRNQLEH